LRKLYLLLMLALALGLSTPALAQEESYWTDLDPLNSSEASGTGKVMVNGNEVTVTIESHGHSAGLPHAQHIHFGEEARHECPNMDDDADGNGIIQTLEGAPAYGPVQVSLTTEGDVSPESGLAVDRFPTGESNGDVHYERTFELPENMSAQDLEDGVIVQHGISELFEDPAAYDGELKSDLNPDLPEEATVPATCGALETMGMPETGAGGTANSTNVPVMGVALFGAVLAVGALKVARFRGI
jgi:hypothetical protein